MLGTNSSSLSIILMTIEEVTELINQLREKIPQMQVQLHQAEGYRQALVDIQNKKLERKNKT